MKTPPKMHQPRCRRRSSYYLALERQIDLAIAFRHAGAFRIFEDNDPLARVFRALNELALRYILSVFPTYRLHAFLPLAQRERLLLCRFRAMLFEYRQHGFSFEAFVAAPFGEDTQSVQDIFVGALADPFKNCRTRRKSLCRNSLRVVAPGTLPDIEKVPAFFHRDPTKRDQVARYIRPRRRQVAQWKAKNVGNHAADSINSVRPKAT